MIFDLLTSLQEPDQTAPLGSVRPGSTLPNEHTEKVHAVSIYILSMTTADDKARCIFFEAGEGLKVVAWQKFDLQKWSLLDRIYMMQQFL